MSNGGHIYVLINPSIEGLVKIGKTTGDSKERAKELSGATGVPTPFIVAFDAYFDDCSRAEQYVHAVLEQRGYRTADNREFFSVPLGDAVRIILDAERMFGAGTTRPGQIGATAKSVNCGSASQTNPPWQEVLQQAEASRYGTGDTIRDYREALRLYRQAAKMGAVGALRLMGTMYCYSGQAAPEDHEAAFRYFKEGAQKGDLDCYAEMGLLFMRREDCENARKCLRRYFENPPQATVGQYGYWYLKSLRGKAPEFQDALRRAKWQILGYAMMRDLPNTTDKEWAREIIKDLEQWQSDQDGINDEGMEGWPLLHLASAWGQLEFAELLLANGANVNAKNKTGTTPLHCAAWNGHKNIAELLLAKGTDVNARNEQGVTPFHGAACNGHKNMVELLLAKGADINERRGDGLTALGMAESGGHTDTATFLRQLGAKV
jgi:hypothetical protein